MIYVKIFVKTHKLSHTPYETQHMKKQLVETELVGIQP
jgi:hypothetical protein